MKRIARGVDNGLASQIEGRVEYDRNASGLPKALDQTLISRTVFAENNLQSSGSVHVSGGGEGVALAPPDRKHIQHVPGGVVPLHLGQVKVRFGMLDQS